jgi:hypothetical protein
MGRIGRPAPFRNLDRTGRIEMGMEVRRWLIFVVPVLIGALGGGGSAYGDGAPLPSPAVPSPQPSAEPPSPPLPPAPAFLREMVARKEFQKQGRVALYASIAARCRNLDALARMRYGNVGLDGLDALARLGDQFPQLIVDPAIAANLDQFVAFVRHKSPRPAAWATRREFANRDIQRFYRAMVLTADQKESIRKNGVIPKYLLGIDSDRASDLLWKSLRKTPFELVVDQLGGHPESILMSVTRIREVALSVGHFYWKKNPSHQIVLLELGISSVDVLPLPQLLKSGELVMPPWMIPDGRAKDSIRDYMAESLEIQHNGQKVKTYGMSSDVESFVALKIDAAEIKALTVVLPEECNYEFQYVRPARN